LLLAALLLRAGAALPLALHAELTWYGLLPCRWWSAWRCSLKAIAFVKRVAQFHE
jgi:hypothetical protein